jgi:primosomal replication protein N
MNRLLLHASLVQRSAIRYTPAGLPALDFTLKHESNASQDGQPRKLAFELKALAIGEATRALNALPLGAQAVFGGFIAQGRNGRGWILHVTELTADPAPGPADAQNLSAT